jgi:hypothetical protein
MVAVLERIVVNPSLPRFQAGLEIKRVQELLDLSVRTGPALENDPVSGLGDDLVADIVSELVALRDPEGFPSASR